jgi:hypothetical protein
MVPPRSIMKPATQSGADAPALSGMQAQRRENGTFQDGLRAGASWTLYGLEKGKSGTLARPG